MALMLTLFAPAIVFAGEAELAQYEREQLDEGARAMPVLAKLAFREATAAMGQGDRERAEQLLHKALDYYPNYPDPYYTLVRIKVLQLDPEAAIYLVDALLASWRHFPTQSLLAINVAATLLYVLIFVSMITCVAFAFRYLPFAAHQLSEMLHRRFRAVAPGFSAYLLLLAPLALVPGVITALAYLTLACWVYMQRRERTLMLVLLGSFIAMGLGRSYLMPLSVVGDPSSLTSLTARANESAGDSHLIKAIESTDVPALESEKHNACGLLYYRGEFYADAAKQFRDAIAASPEDPAGYINLANVHFVEGRYEKALQGYRKAEGIEPMDPVCQHDLAQAYIKTLLMKEASQALTLASDLGIDKVKASYGKGTLKGVTVLPKTFSNRDLWRMAWVEGQTMKGNLLDELVKPFTGSPMRPSAWILLGALVIAVLLSRIVPQSRLTFQCSNCGNLTCESCCREANHQNLCSVCAGAITDISSEKVIGALLRQKRQAAIVKRGRASRITTRLLPGIRDVMFGRVWRASKLSALFSVSMIFLVTRGLVVGDTMRIIPGAPLWQVILPAFGVLLAFIMSATSKPKYDFRTRRLGRGKRIEKSGPVEKAA